MADRVSITSPVGRMVAGSLYKEVTTDFDGNPLKYKTGPKVGQSRVEFYFGLAIPKTRANWWEESWGQQILNVGSVAFPGSYQRKDFAWKITDGDSTEVNKRNKRPCDNEGYKSHWVLSLRGGYAPKIYRFENGTAIQELTPDYVKPGYYIEVLFNVEGNGNQNNPGVYLNHSMVCFRAYGPEISFGPDVNTAGFGQGALPPGASLAPPPSSIPMPAGGPVPSAGAIPASIPAPSAPAVAASPIPASSAGVSPIPVLPNPQFLQVPAPSTTGGMPSNPQSGVPSPVAGAIPLPPASASPSSPRYRMTAQGTREEWHAKGWTDAQMIQGGYMVQE